MHQEYLCGERERTMSHFSPEVLTVLMFGGLLIGIFLGHRLAFVLGGLAIIFGYISWGPSIFAIFINRIWGLMDNYVLLAIPLFIFMAQLLNQSGVADDLFDALRYLLGTLKGGIGITVVIVSTIFAACTGIIGASVVTMGFLALPIMNRYGYDKKLSYGTICAGGTLGILIPPSIMLVIMASEGALSVGQLFAGAIIPGFILSVLYIGYVLIKCHINPELGPPLSAEEYAAISKSEIAVKVVKSLLPPMLLVIGVLGSIFFGIATPTEGAAVGAFLTFILVLAYKKFTWKGFFEAMMKTGATTTMVMMVAIGATCFTGVFIAMGGKEVVTGFVLGLGLGKWGTFWVMMFIVFILGMFIDWLGIVLLCFPVFLPLASQLGFDPIWFVVMIAVNLQASFLTPPFGYALFYLKGVSPSEISISDLYRGIVPYIILMLIGLFICAAFPQIVLWLPSIIVG